jgi:hypothetical protein
MASQDSSWFATVTVKAHQRSKPENGFDNLGHVSAVGAMHAKFLTLYFPSRFMAFYMQRNVPTSPINTTKRIFGPTSLVLKFVRICEGKTSQFLPLD